MAPIDAMPTMFKGFRFRSNLEARWAALFDRLGFLWDYEPIVGAGMVADFLLTVPRHDESIIVSVKPAMATQEFINEAARLADAFADWPGPKLVLGASLGLKFKGSNGPRPALGMFVRLATYEDFGDYDRVGRLISWWVELRHCATCGLVTFEPERFDQYLGPCHGPLEPMPVSVLDRYWAAAGRDVQWKGDEVQRRLEAVERSRAPLSDWAPPKS